MKPQTTAKAEARALSLLIPGRPMAKQRPRLGASGQFYTPDPTGYEEHVAAAWLDAHGRNPFTGPISVTLTFRFGRNPGTQVTVEPWDRAWSYTGRPDGDNCEKVLMDALGPDNSQKARKLAHQLGVKLQGIAWNDDAQIVRMVWEKVKA